MTSRSLRWSFMAPPHLLRAKCPRSVLRKRESLPFASARSMAEYMVASGVGAVVDHSPFSFIAAIMSTQRIGSPFAFRTSAAASRQLIALGFFSLGALGVFALATFSFGAFAPLPFF